MSPAFSSIKDAGAFALLLLIILLLPILVPKSALPPREQIYATLSWNVGPYPFIHQQIYDEKSDIDIAIIGSSRIWCAINTPYLQEQLSEKLGRKAVVISLCWPWTGFDAVYFIAQDILQHRRVHTLVFTDESGLYGVQTTPHDEAWRWFRFEDDADALRGIPLQAQLTYYYGSILGLPRNLLSLIRPNLAPDLSPERTRALEADHHWVMPTQNLGAAVMLEGYFNRPDLFEKFTGKLPASPSDVISYTPQTAADFHFEMQPAPTSLQTHFVKKFGELAQANHTALVCLNVPHLDDRESKQILERFFWPDVMESPVTLLGIVPSVLFAGMSEEDVEKLYWDRHHFNQNGQDYFTHLITPKLIEIYDTPPKS